MLTKTVNVKNPMSTNIPKSIEELKVLPKIKATSIFGIIILYPPF